MVNFRGVLFDYCRLAPKNWGFGTMTREDFTVDEGLAHSWHLLPFWNSSRFSVLFCSVSVVELLLFLVFSGAIGLRSLEFLIVLGSFGTHQRRWLKAIRSLDFLYSKNMAGPSWAHWQHSNCCAQDGLRGWVGLHLLPKLLPSIRKFRIRKGRES